MQPRRNTYLLATLDKKSPAIKKYVNNQNNRIFNNVDVLPPEMFSKIEKMHNTIVTNISDELCKKHESFKDLASLTCNDIQTQNNPETLVIWTQSIENIIANDLTVKEQTNEFIHMLTEIMCQELLDEQGQLSKEIQCFLKFNNPDIAALTQEIAKSYLVAATQEIGARYNPKDNSGGLQYVSTMFLRNCNQSIDTNEIVSTAITEVKEAPKNNLFDLDKQIIDDYPTPTQKLYTVAFFQPNYSGDSQEKEETTPVIKEKGCVLS
jgi:hypothetical protein